MAFTWCYGQQCGVLHMSGHACMNEGGMGQPVVGTSSWVCRCDDCTDLRKLGMFVELYGFRVVDVPGNGDCMFLAVQRQLCVQLGVEHFWSVARLRLLVYDVVCGQRDFYRPFVCADVNVSVEGCDGVSKSGDGPVYESADGQDERGLGHGYLFFERYLSSILKPGFFGDHIMLQALASGLGVQVTVLDCDGSETSVTGRWGDSGGAHLWLGFVCGNHYVSLEPC